MDIVEQQPKTPRNSKLEDEVLSSVNDVLQKLIASVDDMLRDNEFLSCSRAEHSNINEGEKNVENKQDEVKNRIMYSTFPRTEQSNLTIKEQIYYQNYFQDFFKYSEFKNGSTSMPPTACTEEQISSKNKQDYLMESNEYMTRPSNCQLVLDVKEEEKCHENNQDLEPLNKYFDEGLVNNEHIDIVRISPVRELSPNNDWVSTDSTFSSRENSSGTTTERSFEDFETSTDSSDIDVNVDDEDFIIDEPAKEVGDQEENLDNRAFFERIVQYVRETDMLLMANRGGGDHMNFDIDDDSDDESTNEMFEQYYS